MPRSIFIVDDSSDIREEFAGNLKSPGLKSVAKRAMESMHLISYPG
jgi:hypothetical protein